MECRPIGVFDSGVGGLSVLRECMRVLPNERFIYYGDNGNAPYGDRTPEEILALTNAGVDVLMARDIKALVLACNTATAVAAGPLRDRLPIPVIAIEPALKPAAALRKDGLVLVMATAATLAQPKFTKLLREYGEGVVTIACSGLADQVERGNLEGKEIDALLTQYLSPYLSDKIDVVVLGCTHYSFLRDSIRQLINHQIPVIDGSFGTALQLKRVLLKKDELCGEGGEGGYEVITTGGDAVMGIYRRLLRD